MARVAEAISRVVALGLVASLLGLILWIAYAQVETPEEKEERLQAAPAVACEAMLRDSRRVRGDEIHREVDEHYTEDDLRYVEDLREHAMEQLDGTTDPDAQVLVDYLEHDEYIRDAVGQTGDVGLAQENGPMTNGLRERAISACTDLGYPEWEAYLRQEAMDEGDL